MGDMKINETSRDKTSKATASCFYDWALSK
jgi:hypothetical protein